MKYFQFWKDNRLDQEFKLSSEVLIGQFKDWLEARDKDWLDYYSSGIVNFFVTMSDGLSSIGNDDERASLEELLRPHFKEFMEPYWESKN